MMRVDRAAVLSLKVDEKSFVLFIKKNYTLRGMCNHF